MIKKFTRTLINSIVNFKEMELSIENSHYNNQESKSISIIKNDKYFKKNNINMKNLPNYILMKNICFMNIP